MCLTNFFGMLWGGVSAKNGEFSGVKVKFIETIKTSRRKILHAVF